MYHEKKDWRTCDNCASKHVCAHKDLEKCIYHIDETSPQPYWHIQSALEPVWAWLNLHYPNETKILIDKRSAQLLTEHKTFYSEDFRTNNAFSDLRK